MIKMAFRNIFRNKKRTVLAIISVALGIGGLIFGLSYIKGLELLFQKENTKVMGEVRVTVKNYELKSKLMDVSSSISVNLKKKILKIEGVKRVDGIINFGAYIFSDNDDSKGLGFGVEKNSYIKDKVYRGKFLTKIGDIVVGKKIQEKLNLKIGDKITVLTATKGASTFALNYKISGFYNIGGPLNNSFSILLNDAMYLLDMEGEVTELHVYGENIKLANTIKLKLMDILKTDNVEIKKWDEIGAASITQVWNATKAVMIIILGLLSAVVIVNTMVMSVFERKKEIGVMKAFGMSRIKIIKLICTEGLFMGVIGSLLGILIGGFAGYYFSVNGIFLGSSMNGVMGNIDIGDTLYTKLAISDIIVSGITGIIVGIFASFIPAVIEIRKRVVRNLYE
ncbi:ABC transporter permease [Haliovirga abyssi]|uniref:ABC transporter permease n=1 Tax=Haliovirga abyssi TaxID=2996794 RepID=A0AAU9D275_9FUSO|nr:FtsX-like permease family protein [Haliovirga abyssi]BDU50089.1 ABC transporter permease [Haliovirga abyssi]